MDPRLFVGENNTAAEEEKQETYGHTDEEDDAP